MSDGRPTLAVAYGPRSVPVMQLAQAAAARCDVVWLIDGRVGGMDTMSRLLKRFGPVVDIGGLDAGGAARALAEWKPDGLATYFDAGMVGLAELADKLGLPFHSPATARALVDKPTQRAVLAEAGVEGPPCWVLPPGAPGAALDAVPPDADWPLVLKPRSESGSRHTFLARDRAEAEDLLASVGADLGEMVAEGFIPSDPDRAASPYADYVSVEALVTDGSVTPVAVTGRFPPAPTFRETGFFIPAVLSHAETEAALALNEAAAKALGVTDGCLHTEVKFTPSGARLIEVNGRLGGGIPDMLSLAAGVSLLELSVDVALRQPLAVTGLVDCHKVGYRFFLQPPQIVDAVREVRGIDTISGHPGVDGVTVHRGPGSTVDWRDGTRTYVMAVVGSGPDHDAVLEVDRMLREDVTVVYEGTGG